MSETMARGLHLRHNPLYFSSPEIPRHFLAKLYEFIVRYHFYDVKLVTSFTPPRHCTSRPRELLARHDLREHLQRRRTPWNAPPHVCGNFVTRAEDA